MWKKKEVVPPEEAGVRIPDAAVRPGGPDEINEVHVESVRKKARQQILFTAILFIALFAGVGITMLVSAWKIWKRVREDQDQVPVNLEADETKSEKDGPGSDK